MLQRIVIDFLELPIKRKIQIIILLIAICFGAVEYDDTYLNQKVPAMIMNEYIMFPLPADRYSVKSISANDYRKLSVFSISWVVEDSDKTYEIKIMDYLSNNGYKFKEGVYINNTYIVSLKRKGDFYRVTLEKIIRGEFDEK